MCRVGAWPAPRGTNLITNPGAPASIVASVFTGIYPEAQAMQRNLVLITAGIIFCFCTIAQAQDGAPGLSKAEFSGTERLTADCGALLDARTQARLTLQRDRHALE